MRPSWGLAAALSLAVSACLVQPGLAAASPARTQGVPTPGYGSELSAVGCGSAGQCWAVGNYVTKTQAPQNEILRWTGHGWQLATVPLSRGQSGLSAISCPAAVTCLAVGSTANVRGKAARAEVLRWDGTRWLVASAPAGVASLDALACTAPDNCWALDSNDSQFIHWNGQSWAKPVPFSYFDAPNAITCLSATDCWAAGFYVKPNGLNLYNLVMHWNGQAWSPVRVPQPPGGANQLHAVTCVSQSDCWAAGSDEAGTSPRIRNEALHWNGTRWSVVPTPKGPLVNSELLGIECATRSRCWAVGDDEGGTQALHWNGQHWSLVPAPDPGGAGFLFDVACLGHTDCLAVGFSHIPPTQNLAVHWNGRKWKAT